MDREDNPRSLLLCRSLIATIISKTNRWINLRLLFLPNFYNQHLPHHQSQNPVKYHLKQRNGPMRQEEVMMVMDVNNNLSIILIIVNGEEIFQNLMNWTKKSVGNVVWRRNILWKLSRMIIASDLRLLTARSNVVVAQNFMTEKVAPSNLDTMSKLLRIIIILLVNHLLSRLAWQLHRPHPLYHLDPHHYPRLPDPPFHRRHQLQAGKSMVRAMLLYTINILTQVYNLSVRWNSRWCHY